MTADVISLKGGEIKNERRALFVQAVAATFDFYVERHGYEPDALVYVICGLKQPSIVAWDIRGESKGGGGSILSQAAVHVLAEAQSTHKPIDL